MFTVNVHKSGHTEYELRDNKSNSYIRIIPSLGGIATAFNIKGEDILYLDKAVLDTPNFPSAGGIPVLFPVCGRLTDGQYEAAGRKYSMPGHGFARTSQWKVEETRDGDTGEIALVLEDNEDTLKVYPFRFRVEFRYVLEGNTLTLHQLYKNKGTVDMPFYAGFHPYFTVGNKNALTFDINAGRYIDYNDSQMKEYKGNVDFGHPVDFVFFLNDRNGSHYEMKDPDKGRKLVIETAEEFKYMVMWTMQGRDFVCIEPWMAAPDAMNTKKDLYRLAPGKSLKTWIKMRVESL
jgi:galactose mutarotase-like enzyme